MRDPTILAGFHFEHPVWLLGIPAAVLLYVLHSRTRDVTRRWKHLIDPALLTHLMLDPDRERRFRPAHLTFLLAGLGSIALSGPAWKRVPPPFVEDKAALVIVLDASRSMQAVDVQPSRMIRAQQKVRDLLDLRAGARSALVAYAGSAHIVLPLTDDRGVLELYVDAISPQLMPVEGDKPAEALRLAQAILDEQKASGSILFLSDGIPEADRPAFVAHRKRGGAPLLALALGTDRGGPLKTPKGAFVTDGSGARVTSKLDRAGFEALASSADMDVTYATVDASDVEDVAGNAQRNLAAAQAEDESLRWDDAGVWLLIPIVILIALWFRRGWSVRWAVAVLLGFSLFHGELAWADESGWSDLWWTQDQQGRRHFEAGEYEDAAAHFEDPLWKGIAYYRAEQYSDAIDQFARLDTAEAWFNLANAQAHLGKYERALDSYDKALARRADYPAAETNKRVVAAAWKRQREKEEEPPAEGGDTLGADEVVEADPNDKTKRPEVEEQVAGGEMDESMAEIWMRQVQTTPAGFLQRKFAIQQSEHPPLKARREDDR